MHFPETSLMSSANFPLWILSFQISTLQYCFEFWAYEMSAWSRLGEYGDRRMTLIAFLAKNSR